MKGILGKKLGMMQAFDDTGRRVPLTVVQATPGVVVRVKDASTDGYAAVQVGFDACELKTLNRPEAGVFKKALQTKTGYKTLKEFRVDNPGDFKVGQEIKADQFSAGDLVDVRGISIGKGFAGTIKRYHFSCGPKTHGSKNKREPGSIGLSATPSRVHKRKKMPGHLGAVRRTIQRITVFKVDEEKNLIFLIGGIPGSRNGTVTIQETVKKTNQAV